MYEKSELLVYSGPHEYNYYTMLVAIGTHWVARVNREHGLDALEIEFFDADNKEIKMPLDLFIEYLEKIKLDYQNSFAEKNT